MPNYDYVAVILEGVARDVPFRPILVKHAAFEAVLENDEVTIRFYDGIAQMYRVMPMPKGSVRLIKRGAKPFDPRIEIEDYVQIVGRKRGGIVNRYHFTAGITVLFANGSKSDLSWNDLTYDDVRGIWYYTETE